MAYAFTAPLMSDGKLLLEVDCEVDVLVEFSPAEVEITITNVLVEGVDLLESSSAWAVAMGREIVALASEDESLRERILIDEGISYVGLGGNDPDGRMVRHIEREAA